MTVTAKRRQGITPEGIRYDATGLGAGLYTLIQQKGEEAIVAFGMIPKWAIDGLNNLLDEKIRAERPDLSSAQRAASARVIEKAVCTEIYAAASAAGRMVC